MSAVYQPAQGMSAALMKSLESSSMEHTKTSAACEPSLSVSSSLRTSTRLNNKLTSSDAPDLQQNTMSLSGRVPSDLYTSESAFSSVSNTCTPAVDALDSVSNPYPIGHDRPTSTQAGLTDEDGLLRNDGRDLMMSLLATSYDNPREES